jgi:hypothetical protein
MSDIDNLNGASMDPRDHDAMGIDKDQLAMRTMTSFGELENVLGHDKAAEEMAHALGKYVLAGELNQFEADMISTVAMLGKIANNVMDENDRLRDGSR